jgi:hypothetical protein
VGLDDLLGWKGQEGDVMLEVDRKLGLDGFESHS